MDFIKNMNLTKKNKIVALLVVLSSFGISLLAVEYFLVWENYFAPYDVSLHEVNGKVYRFQYPVHELFKAGNVTSTRIFVLGDSFVAGTACQKKGTNLTGHLQKLLTRNQQVVNLGVGGADPSNYIDFIGHFPIRPNDLVIVVLYDNDIHMSKETCELSSVQLKNYPIFYPSHCDELISGAIASKDQDSFLKRMNNKIKQFKTIALLKEAFYNIPIFSRFFFRSEYVTRWERFESEENQWIMSTLPVMKSMVEKRGAQFFLTYYPNTNNISPNDVRHNIWINFKKELINRHKLELLDPYPFFISKATSKSMVWSLTDKHPSCDAHAIMSQFLFDVINRSL